MDFCGFITNFADSVLDIECKKSTFIIYEKNARFDH